MLPVQYSFRKCSQKHFILCYTNKLQGLKTVALSIKSITIEDKMKNEHIVPKVTHRKICLQDFVEMIYVLKSIYTTNEK